MCRCSGCVCSRSERVGWGLGGGNPSVSIALGLLCAFLTPRQPRRIFPSSHICISSPRFNPATEPDQRAALAANSCPARMFTRLFMPVGFPELFTSFEVVLPGSGSGGMSVTAAELKVKTTRLRGFMVYWSNYYKEDDVEIKICGKHSSRFPFIRVNTSGEPEVTWKCLEPLQDSHAAWESLEFSLLPNKRRV